MENMNKEYTFLFNPNFRLQSKYLHVNSFLVDNEIIQTESQFSPLENKYVSNGSCSVIVIREISDLSIIYSEQTKWENPRLQSWIRKQIKTYIIDIAENVLPRRLHYWEKEKNLYAKNVLVKKLRSNVLGQCDNSKTICLSPRIILLPQSSMDCVILHEMAHLKFMHHRKSFWNFLSELLGEDSVDQRARADVENSKFYLYSKFLLK
jgi:predicted metal-dependent hydrolase